ncbi:MAG: nitroreductase family protein, partial [Acidobacteriota bacterium]
MEPDNSDRLQWIIEHRHSTRAPYDPAQTVSDRELARIVDAARWAPTAHNMQNFEILVVDDPEILQRIDEIPTPVSEVFLRENYQQLS